MKMQLLLSGADHIVANGCLDQEAGAGLSAALR